VVEVPGVVDAPEFFASVNNNPPRTAPATSVTDTPSSMATKALQRAVSSVPAMPTTRFFGKPAICLKV
jgi:hypothetical protein